MISHYLFFVFLERWHWQCCNCRQTVVVKVTVTLWFLWNLCACVCLWDTDKMEISAYFEVFQCELDVCHWDAGRMFVMSQSQVSCQGLSEQVSETLVPLFTSLPPLHALSFVLTLLVFHFYCISCSFLSFTLFLMTCQLWDWRGRSWGLNLV